MQSSSMFRIQLPNSTLSLISEAPHRKRYAVDVPYAVANFNAVSDMEGSPRKEICSLVYVPYTVMLSTLTLQTLVSSQTPSTGLRHPFSARTHTHAPWRKVPESDARSVTSSVHAELFWCFLNPPNSQHGPQDL